MDSGLHWTRRFYRRHLARYGWARRLKGIVVQAWFGYLHVRYAVTWRVQYNAHLLKLALAQRVFARSQTFARITSRLSRDGAIAKWLSGSTGFFSLQPLAAYRQSVHPRVFTLTPAESVELRMPQVYPASYRNRFPRQSWRTVIPEVEAVEITDAELIGRCEFVFTSLSALHHDLYDFRFDLPGEEMHSLVSIETKKGVLRRYAKGRGNAEVEEAISLLGWPSANYIHWLTEYLPKLALVDEIPELAELPLAADANLHPNILESLRLCNVHNRTFVTLSPGEVLRLKRVILITPTAYAPFDYRFGAKLQRVSVNPDRAMFVPRAIHALRDRLLSAVTVRGSAGARRLFLQRNSYYRQIKNTEEVESFFRTHGFEIVEPERLSFAEQVKLASTAEIIVSQAGAALGNMLFAPEGCCIIILSAWSPYNNYYYFSNLASILQQRCVYVLCDSSEEESGVHPAHRSPIVDVQLLEEVICHVAKNAV